MKTYNIDRAMIGEFGHFGVDGADDSAIVEAVAEALEQASGGEWVGVPHVSAWNGAPRNSDSPSEAVWLAALDAAYESLTGQAA